MFHHPYKFYSISTIVIHIFLSQRWNLYHQKKRKLIITLVEIRCHKDTRAIYLTRYGGGRGVGRGVDVSKRLSHLIDPFLVSQKHYKLKI